MTTVVTREEVKQAMDNGQNVTILEALGEAYYAKGHLPGAARIDHTRVGEQAANVAPDKARPVIVYCANDRCQNSHIAARVLEQLGYRDVRVYAAGKDDWTRAGLTLETR
jgi:rhodanese-related sulfurtransferase